MNSKNYCGGCESVDDDDDDATKVEDDGDNDDAVVDGMGWDAHTTILRASTSI